MKKLSFEDWKNSMSFMIDDAFDERFLGSTKSLTKFINSSCEQFQTKEGLALFLGKDSENFTAELKLKALVSLIGFSEERLKRVISLVRFKFLKEDFRSEWSIKKISKSIVANSKLLEFLVDFFIHGRKSIIGKEIPLYYLRNFKLLDAEFIQDLSEFNYVDRILNDNEIQGRYSNEVGAHVEKIISKRLDDYKRNINLKLEYDTQKEFPLLHKNIDFLIPKVGNPKILIESSYNITTGSGQSKRADQLVELYGVLMKYNANQRADKILMLNYCDGFGWVGRQNDLRRIYEASDFVFNQNNLDVLNKVLDEYY